MIKNHNIETHEKWMEDVSAQALFIWETNEWGSFFQNITWKVKIFQIWDMLKIESLSVIKSTKLSFRKLHFNDKMIKQEH